MAALSTLVLSRILLVNKEDILCHLWHYKVMFYVALHPLTYFFFKFIYLLFFKILSVTNVMNAWDVWVLSESHAALYYVVWLLVVTSGLNNEHQQCHQAICNWTKWKTVFSPWLSSYSNKKWDTKNDMVSLKVTVRRTYGLWVESDRRACTWQNTGWSTRLATHRIQTRIYKTQGDIWNYNRGALSERENLQKISPAESVLF